VADPPLVLGLQAERLLLLLNYATSRTTTSTCSITTSP
jgi:hypothetical protein